MLYTFKRSYLRIFSLFKQRDQYGPHYNIHYIPPRSSPYYLQYIIKNPRSHIRENYTGYSPIPIITQRFFLRDPDARLWAFVLELPFFVLQFLRSALPVAHLTHFIILKSSEKFFYIREIFFVIRYHSRVLSPL